MPTFDLYVQVNKLKTKMEEVRKAGEEKRRELVISGQSASKFIEENGLDDELYHLTCLNYLSISKTCLRELSPILGNLVNLTNLVLHNNQLTALPGEIQALSKLKFFDVSNNQIKEMPESISNLSELESLNVSVNELNSFPPVGNLKSLHIFNVAHNSLTELPEGIFDPKLVHLSQIIAGNNEIESLSPNVTELPHLNMLDMSNNKLKEVPAELSECPKLKDLNLKGNKFSDRRFGKLVEQCATKSVMEYLSNNLKKERAKNPDKKGKGKSKEKKKKGQKADDDDDVEFLTDTIDVLHFPNDDDGLVVSITPAVLSVRPYIVCCIVKNLDLQKTANKFKQFITLQTKLHDTLCNKRQAATIATHDLSSVKGPLKFDAQFPPLLMIVPLSKQKEVSGETLVEDLMKEAEQIRREKKRNAVSGIHKYLDLLKDRTQYPCLTDSEGTVISFPPITNSNNTKISKETSSILIEVTSSTSLDVCKKICDELLVKMLEMGLGKDSADEASPSAGQKTLTVEQVKVTDEEGNLRVVYPSRTDLSASNPGITVNRNYE